MRIEHDMSTIVHPVTLLANTEYERAAMIHGKLFSSSHEGYGVIAEELHEAAREEDRAQKLMYRLLKAIHEENADAIADKADYIRCAAINTAAEMVQVAAMCTKLIKTVGGETDEAAL
jgi:hypothetical protein